MNILGIDPGLNGAIVLIDGDGKILQKFIMPIMEVKKVKPKKIITSTGEVKKRISKKNIFLEDKLYDIFNMLTYDYKIDMVYLEQVQAMPRQGVTSMFNFGFGFGLIKMALVANQLPYKLIHPKTWCKVMHMGLSKDIDAKTRSKMIFGRQYPDLDFRPTSEKTGKLLESHHDGLIDALLIAEYGRKDMIGEIK